MHNLPHWMCILRNRTLFTLDVHSIRNCAHLKCRIQTLFTLQVQHWDTVLCNIRICSHCALWTSAGCRWCRHRSKIIDHQLGAGNHQTKASLHLRWEKRWIFFGRSEFWGKKFLISWVNFFNFVKFRFWPNSGEDLGLIYSVVASIFSNFSGSEIVKTKDNRPVLQIFFCHKMNIFSWSTQ